VRIYNITILPLSLFASETWSLVSREEHKLRVFEIRVLRRLFGPMRNEVIGGWRQVDNKQLHDLYTPLIINGIIKSKGMRWVWHVAQIEKKRNVYSLLVGKLEGKRPLGRLRRRWVDNITIDLVEIILGGFDWIG
jgi:hypothetical protein